MVEKALIASAVLVVLVAGGIFAMLGHIQKSATSPDHAEAWADKVAELSGTVLGVGLVVTWTVFWLLGRKP